MEAKAGGLVEARKTDLSPQITVDAPILIPDDYVPDLDLRMSLYRRINDLDDAGRIDAFAAELIDRFGPLPDATENLLTLMAIKLNAKAAQIAKIDVGARGALVTFWNDNFPNINGLLAYVERLNGVAKLRPDNKLSITRTWSDPKARLNGALQLSKGLAKVAG
jgi:transcription-repair coupling factor (superfamily II helicase)